MPLFIFLAENEFFYDGRVFPIGEYYTTDKMFIAKSQSMVRVTKVLKGGVHIGDLGDLISFDYIRRPVVKQEVVVETGNEVFLEMTASDTNSMTTETIIEPELEPVEEPIIEDEVIEVIEDPVEKDEVDEKLDEIVDEIIKEEPVVEQKESKEEEIVQDEKENEISEETINKLSEELASE